MKEAAVKGDEYRVWWCSLFVVFMWGSSCVMTPLILTSDVLLTQALSIWSWTNLLSFVVSALIFVSHSLDSLYHITMLLFLNLFLYIMSLLKHVWCLFFQSVQLWNLLVHAQPLHYLLHHPDGAHGRVGLRPLMAALNLRVCKWVCGFISAWVDESRRQDKSLLHVWMSANIGDSHWQLETSLNITQHLETHCRLSSCPRLSFFISRNHAKFYSLTSFKTYHAIDLLSMKYNITYSTESVILFVVLTKWEWRKREVLYLLTDIQL